MEGEGNTNWSERVEELVDEGHVDKAVSLLESLVSKFEALNSPNSDLQLSSALFDLSKLYSSGGFSLKADEVQSRALLIRQRAHRTTSPEGDIKIAENDLVKDGVAADMASACNGSSKDGCLGKCSESPGDALPPEGSSDDDDWEAIADRAPEDLLSPACLPGVSKLSLEDTKVQSPKRRGRGTFSYRKHGLYSDQQSDEPITDCSRNEDVCHSSEGDTEMRKSQEACNCIQCPFTFRILDENDVLLSSIPTRDLEPPLQRPETSTRTARRLIAQGMGIKLPSTSFGSQELRKQEEARRNRIVSRQNMRDDAWGDDVN